MRILFVMRHSGYVRNFESTLRLLCDRGHTVLLAFQVGGTHWLLDPSDVTREMTHQYPRFSRDMIPVRDDSWGHVGRELRLSLDYLRYLRPEYRDAPKLRERAAREVPAQVIARATSGVWSTGAGRATTAGVYRQLLRALPTDVHIDAFLEANRPDVLAVTPLIEPGAPQAEYLRSARSLGIRTALCVASWDNLTNKGLIHGHLDLVTVWNEAMKREAIELHGVPPERVAVTGAQPFDHWFGWKPSRTREQFQAEVGLPAQRPYLLYLCSSRFIAPSEVPFVRRWLQALRASSSPLLKDLGVLIRPHPQNADQWHGVDLRELGPVVIWPREGAPPSTDQNRNDYFDSIYHGAGVIGVNTTAEIESAIVGRRVFTVMDPDFKDTQHGTLHFEHLRQVNGGLLHAAADLEEHVAQLDAALRHPTDDERCRRFVEAFVRPHGLGEAATPRLADALEALSREPVLPPERMPAWAPLGRALLASRGRRLQREALLVRETKAAKARKRKKTASAPAAQETAGTPR